MNATTVNILSKITAYLPTVSLMGFLKEGTSFSGWIDVEKCLFLDGFNIYNGLDQGILK